jgi:HEAT repeat protein
MAELATTSDPDRLQELLWSLGTRRRGDGGALRFLQGHPAATVRAALAEALGSYRDRAARDLLLELCADPDPDVCQAAAESLLDRRGAAALPALTEPGDDPAITAAVQQWQQATSGGNQPQPPDNGAA